MRVDKHHCHLPLLVQEVFLASHAQVLIEAQSLCAAIALPAAAIVTVGTGFGLVIGHLLDHHIDPPPPTTRAFRYLMGAILFGLAGVLLVTWDYYRQFKPTSPASSQRGSQAMPTYHDVKPGAVSHADSIPEYVDEVPMDLVSANAGRR